MYFAKQKTRFYAAALMATLHEYSFPLSLNSSDGFGLKRKYSSFGKYSASE
jgi:hypothetical protein